MYLHKNGQSSVNLETLLCFPIKSDHVPHLQIGSIQVKWLPCVFILLCHDFCYILPVCLSHTFATDFRASCTIEPVGFILLSCVFQV